LQPIYQREFNYQLGDFPIAEKTLSSAVTLPLHLGLEDNDVDFIIGCIRRELFQNDKGLDYGNINSST